MSLEDIEGGGITEDLPEIVVQQGLHFPDQGFSDDGGITSLGYEPSDHAVVPLIRPPLPGGIGMGIVDLGARLFHADGQLGELRAIVRGYAPEDLLEGIAILALDIRHRLTHAGCCLVLHDPDDGLPADALDDGEQDSLLGLLEQHAVDLPVSEDGPVVDFCF